MLDEAYVWEWHKLKLENALANVDGDAFESLFQELCKTSWGVDFTPTIPMGSRGDLKCDGYRHSSKTVFQCYGPRYGQMNVDSALAKIDDDFSGAVSHWKDEIRSWVFVTNAYRGKVPSEVVRHIADQSALLKVAALIWDRADVLEFARAIPTSERVELLGRPPVPAEMLRVTYENIGRALAAIRSAIVIDPNDRVEEPPDSELKRKSNLLSQQTAEFIALGKKAETRVRKYLAAQVVPEEADRMAGGFISRYQHCKAKGLEPDEIFRQMVIFAGGATGESIRDSAALAIVSYFFLTCQIFEPPEALAGEL